MVMSPRFLCVHAHFYQPPREDPFTGMIPIEPGASPYPNWNERIHAECYQPNAELGNFERLSFNLGPTLCAWLAENHPATLQKIVAQDKANVDHYGVGNAIAQPYHHTILPLASCRDKVTQVRWGIADFERRFGRKPLGMWLPETAVDLETLSVLAGHGIAFTILAPWQAATPDLDVRSPYRVHLPAGQDICVFFYHQGLSTGLSFNSSVSTNADQFIQGEVLPHFKPDGKNESNPQLILIASDGELYGHHQPLRDHFLAHLLNGASSSAGIQPVFPARWLQEYPARQVVAIREKTSWSCHHGLTRWMGSCDCTPGNNLWKARLRLALDRLAQALDELYTQAFGQQIADVWALRDGYIQVVLGARSAEDLVAEHACHALTARESRDIQLWLKAQYERQRMFTSCGWFFEDFDRIEPRNNLAYAANAVRLAKIATGADLSGAVLRDLHGVISERTGLRGDQVFKKYLHL